MHSGRLVFSQLMDFCPWHEFATCVRRYRGQYRLREFSCLDQFLTMTYAQLTARESLREIEVGLRALSFKLYHAGFRGRVSRSTLADANEKRDWRIYADFAQVLIRIARRLYAHDDFGVALGQAAYALDSTTIDLCRSLFPWARFRRRKRAIKLHTLLDLQGRIPCFICITHGKTHDVKILDVLVLEPGAFYMFDRGYLDFRRLYRFTQGLAFFVTRSKSNFAYRRRSYRRVDKSTGLRSDQTIILKGRRTSRRYPAPLRLITYYDAEQQRTLAFLTNNFELPAWIIVQLYKCRWRIELFFKWIKQHLRIKAFLGTSENAVKTQVWIAISAYVLVAILKKELGIERELREILQILSIAPFEQVPLRQLLTAGTSQIEKSTRCKQLALFDL